MPVGVFADPSFPPPTVSVYDSRRHPWIALPPGVETDDAWTSLRPLYEAGEYAEVADRAGDLIAAEPENAQLLYNVACCESLRRADDGRDRPPAARDRPVGGAALGGGDGDSDFDPIRDEPVFRELVSAPA